jgi:hypothetical protein
LVEQINYNLLYRWFVGLTIDDTVWNHSTFSINRDRLLENDVIPELFEEVVGLASKQKLLSDEHFSVDGTLIQAWASQKSYRRKDHDSEPPTGGGRNSEANLYGEKRSNETHESKTDGEARLAVLLSTVVPAGMLATRLANAAENGWKNPSAGASQ